MTPPWREGWLVIATAEFIHEAGEEFILPVKPLPANRLTAASM